MRRFNLSFICFIIVSTFFMSCSLLGPKDYCDLQFKVPAKTVSTDANDTELWHVVVSNSKNGNIILSDSYKSGQTVQIDSVLAGQYDIKVFGSNGDAVYSKSTTTKVTPGKINTVDIYLEKQANIKAALNTFGSINNIQNAKDGYYCSKYEQSHYFVSRLYVFDNFNENFYNFLYSFDKAAFNSGFQQGNSYNLDESKKYAIEITAVLNNKNLSIDEYVVSIRDLDISNNYLYGWLSPKDFYELTTPDELEKIISLKKSINEKFETNITTKMSNLGAPGTEIEILTDPSVAMQTDFDDENLVYYRQLYIYNGHLNEKIQSQLRDKDYNCYFSFDTTDYLKPDPNNEKEYVNSIIQVEMCYNKQTNTDKFYSIRFCDKESMQYGDYGTGFEIGGIPPKTFDNFISGNDPEYKFPEIIQRGPGVYITLPTEQELNSSYSPNSVTRNNKFYIQIKDSKNNVVEYYKEDDYTFGEECFFYLADGNYTLLLIGSDGEYLYTHSQPFTAISNEAVDVPVLAKDLIRKNINISNLGTLTEIKNHENTPFNYSYNGEVDDTAYTFKRYYVFSEFTPNFATAIAGKNKNCYLENHSYSEDKHNPINTATTKGIELTVMLDRNGLYIKNYSIAITDNSLGASISPEYGYDAFKQDLNQIAFNDLLDFDKSYTKITNIATSFDNSFNTKLTNFGTNLTKTTHNGLVLYNNGNPNKRIYTVLCSYESDFNSILADQVNGKVANTEFDFSSNGTTLVQIGQVVDFSTGSAVPESYNLILKSNNIISNEPKKTLGYAINGLTPTEFDSFLTGFIIPSSKLPAQQTVTFKMPSSTDFEITDAGQSTETSLFAKIKKNDVIIHNSASLTFEDTIEVQLEPGTYTFELEGSDGNYLYKGKKSFTVTESTTSQQSFNKNELSSFKTDIKTKMANLGIIGEVYKPVNDTQKIDRGKYIHIAKLFVYDSYNKTFSKLIANKKGTEENRHSYGLTQTPTYSIELKVDVTFEPFHVENYRLTIKNDTECFETTMFEEKEFNELTLDLSNTQLIKQKVDEELAKLELDGKMNNLSTGTITTTYEESNLVFPTYYDTPNIGNFSKMYIYENTDITEKLKNQLSDKTMSNFGFIHYIGDTFINDSYVQINVYINKETKEIDSYNLYIHDKTLNADSEESCYKTEKFKSTAELETFLSGPDFTLPVK